MIFRNFLLIFYYISYMIYEESEVSDMTIEEKLKEKILEEYKTLTNFVKHTNLKYTTVDSILKRGIMNSNVQNIIEICKVLNISTDELSKGNIVPLEDIKPIEQNKDMSHLKAYMKAFYKLDNKELTDSEKELINISIDIMLEQIRKQREKIAK